MRGRGGGRALVAGGDALAGLSAPPAPLLFSETKLGFHRPGAETTFAPGAVSGAAAGRGSSAGESRDRGWAVRGAGCGPRAAGGRDTPSAAGSSRGSFDAATAGNEGRQAVTPSSRGRWAAPSARPRLPTDAAPGERPQVLRTLPRAVR